VMLPVICCRLLDETMWCSGEQEMRERAAMGDSGGPLVQILDSVPKLVSVLQLLSADESWPLCRTHL
jgi:hypothetical protein